MTRHRARCLVSLVALAACAGGRSGSQPGSLDARERDGVGPALDGGSPAPDAGATTPPDAGVDAAVDVARPEAGTPAADARPAPAWATAILGTSRLSGLAVLDDDSVVVAAVLGETDVQLGGRVVKGGPIEAMLLARYSAEGTLSWAKVEGGQASLYAGGLAAVPGGRFAVAGHYSESIAPSPAGSLMRVLPPPAGGFPENFVAVYSAAGELAWATAAGATATGAVGVVGLLDGGVVLAADVNRDPDGGKPPDGVILIQPSSRLIRYGPGGTQQWIKAFGPGRPHWMTAGPGGELAIVGTFWNQARFGEGDPNVATLRAASDPNGDHGFVAFFGEDGSFRRASEIQPFPWQVAMASDGRTLVTGGQVLRNLGPTPWERTFSVGGPFGVLVERAGEALIVGAFTGRLEVGGGLSVTDSERTRSVGAIRYGVDGTPLGAKLAASNLSFYVLGQPAQSDGGAVFAGYFEGDTTIPLHPDGPAARFTAEAGIAIVRLRP